MNEPGAVSNRIGVAPIVRFAPSPNGFLHLGHAYSALMNQRCADGGGGRMLLRMEDIDRARCTPAFEAAIGEDLDWLGLRWEQPVRRQSEHFVLYAATLDRLNDRGLLYPCYCTRSDIAHAIDNRPWPHDPDGAPIYPGTCRHLSRRQRAEREAAGRTPCFRLDMTAGLKAQGGTLSWREFRETDAAVSIPAEPAKWGDVILARRDIPASYHVAVVADDAAQGITDIVRGEDLLQATSLHRLLQELLGYRAPDYHHHRIIYDDTGRKLAKSRGSPSLRAMRADRLTSRDVCDRLGLT